MRIVALAVLLAAAAAGFPGPAIAADAPPAPSAPQHLDPAQTIARFLKLTQAGTPADLRAAAKLINQDRDDLAWATDQLDSTSRDLLTSMHVYNFVAILSNDAVAAPPVYSLSTAAPPTPATAPATPTSPGHQPDAAVAAMFSPQPPAPRPTAPPPAPTLTPMPTTAVAPVAPPPAAPPAVTEEQADRAAVRLASGRLIDFVKNDAGDWLMTQYSESLQARARWVAARDRDLDLPMTGQFDGFFLDLQKHPPDYAWRVAMALGEAGRFTDLGSLIDLPAAAANGAPTTGPTTAPANPAAPATPPTPASTTAAGSETQSTPNDLEQQGRALYAWLRRSEPDRVQLQPSDIPLPTGRNAPDGAAAIPAVDGKVANFVIWTNDHKRVRLLVRRHQAAAGTVDLSADSFEWRFDCNCYSAATKRAWIHAQRQLLPSQP
ncbi:MAG: hypothetical protein ACREJ2_02185 [Planctomycetota bacterium]